MWRTLVAKKFCCVFTAGLLVVSVLMVAFGGAIAATDQPSSWALAEIEAADALGLIPAGIELGYKGNTNRREFCQLVMNLVELKTGMPVSDFLAEKGVEIVPTVFSDTNDPLILAANALGIVQGIGGGLFNPNGLLQRQQAAAMLARAAGVLGFVTPNDTSMVFADENEFAPYAVGPIEFISACSDRTNLKRVMGGVGQNKFSPTAPYTKEQAILTMLRLYHSFDYTQRVKPLYIDSIEGSPMQGSVLTAGEIVYNVSPQGAVALNWQWLRSDSETGEFQVIPGATGKSYTSTSSDVGKYVNVSVTVSGAAVGSAVGYPVLIEPFQLYIAPIRPIGGFYPLRTDGTPSSPFAGGKGTESDPYLIATADQFLLLKNNTIDTYFKLANNINLGTNNTITGPFYGHLDGNNKKVTFSTSNGFALFKEITASATVSNLIVAGGMSGAGLKSIAVGRLTNNNYGTVYRCGSEMSSMLFKKSINLRVGALVGRNYGLISECYSTGIIRLELEERRAINRMYPSLADELLSDWNRGWAGGLVGINKRGAVILNSYSHVNVDIPAAGELSYGISGGLVSCNEGDITTCYSVGSVSSNKYRGGLVGSVQSNSSVRKSYYDRHTSGRSDNNGKGIPKTTIEMLKQNTYEGWNDSIWKFYSDLSSYPTLKWQ